MRIDIYKIPTGYFITDQVELHISPEGYLIVDEFDENEAWHLCNWCFHMDEKPKELFSDIDHANDDIIFHNLEEGKFYIALYRGWRVENTFEGVTEYLKKNRGNRIIK